MKKRNNKKYIDGGAPYLLNGSQFPLCNRTTGNVHFAATPDYLNEIGSQIIVTKIESVGDRFKITLDGDKDAIERLL